MINTQTSQLVLSALGISCALGHDKQSVINSIFVNQPQTASSKTQLFSNKQVSIFKTKFAARQLPDEYKIYDTLGNRLLRTVLDQIKDAVTKAKNTYSAQRIGIVLATTTPGMYETELAFATKLHSGVWPSDFDYVKQETASPSIFTAEYLGITGPAYTISTACTSSGKAMLSAKRLINAGICDAVICGGVDTLCEMTLNGFDSLELLTENSCIPFSKNRDGLSLGEGAAVFLLTKERSSDQDIYLLGGFENSDAYHICSPDPTGNAPQQAILQALQSINLKTEDLAYINLHGTGTLLNDQMEANCIHRIFGNSVPCSSTKSLTGHTLGAAGAIEAAILWLALTQDQNGSIPLPVHVWDEMQDPSLPLINLVTAQQRFAKRTDFYALMSNSFAFGGSNVNLILGKKACPN